MNESELTEARVAFKNTKRMFGLKAFLDCWMLYVLPFRKQIKELNDTIRDLKNANGNLRESLRRVSNSLNIERDISARERKQSVSLSSEVGRLRSYIKSVDEFETKENEYTDYEIVLNDPNCNDVYRNRASFIYIDDAYESYEHTKAKHKPSSGTELTLYKRIKLKSVKAVKK